MSKLDKDTVLAAFTKAYEQKHGKAPDIDAGGGWYSIDGGKKVRLADIDRMVNEMQSGGDASTDADKVPEAAEAPPKKQTKPKKKAAQFSVKDFYAQQILAKNPGSKEPR